MGISPTGVSDPRLATGAARLAARHAGRFPVETIERLLADSHARLAETARVHTHLVVLAERFAGQRLDAIVAGEIAPAHRPPRVLFVCGGNIGRSQLAAAILGHRGAGAVEVSSAGTHPAAELPPVIAAVLAEAGIRPADMFPKPLTPEIVGAADYVITMGCGDACPLLEGRRYLDWPLPDPDNAPIETVRAIRDAIDTHITGLLALLPVRTEQDH